MARIKKNNIEHSRLKKLDKLIIKAFIGPFVATFFITLFVLIMQFFWLWIDDFVGKGLDAFTIFKFIWYQSAVLIPLALPLSILLSSLMTFGNLGETFELVAIKSAGISLLRFMRPLFYVTAAISFGAFLFSNYVIPVANLKSRTLLADIVLAKPSLAIKEGVFNDKMENFAIKVGKKDNDSIIRDVIVYEQTATLQDNFIIAKDGIMKPSEKDKRFLDVIFKNGWRYQERGNPADSATEYIRLGFKEYRMQIDVSSFNFKKTEDSANANNEKMYNMRQLDVAIDSMEKYNTESEKRFEDGFFANIMALQYRDSMVKGATLPDSILNFKRNINSYLGVKTKADSVQHAKDSVVAKNKKADSLKTAKQLAARQTKSVDSMQQAVAKNTDTAPSKKVNNDTAKKTAATTAAKKVKVKKDPNSFDALLPDSARQQVEERALSTLGSVKSNIEMNMTNIADQQKTLQKYKIEWHRKIALAAACMVLFMVGAPLGSIIRKGGLGTPMIFAIIFFMVFYFVSTRGEKMAKEIEMSAFTGMWLSTFVLVPIGVFLTYKAMHDSNLFNKEFYTRIKRNLRKKFSGKKV